MRLRADFRSEGSLNGWIWRIVVNTTLSHARAHKPTTPLSDIPSNFHNGHTDAETERVRSALALLPERQRLILFLHYYADLDYRTIGDVLEIETGTVSATLAAAHTSLRDAIEGVRS